ncbi:MAG: protease inhibitor I42 family protein, partial [Anaerolineaceae bacterium]
AGGTFMTKFTLITIILLAGTLLIGACATVTSTPEGKTVVITPQIKGNSASLLVGDTLEIQIPTIPSEGFEWIVYKLDSKILTQVGEAQYIVDDAVNATGGIMVLRFEAIGKGETDLSLLYVSTSSVDRPGFSKHSFGLFVEVK